jgi:phenylalanyl-tRNA synthetase beta chain
MRVSLRWLRRHLSFPLEHDALIASLMRAGLEVDSVTDLGMGSGNILVGQVKKVGKHPEADKLTLCEVDIGAEAPAQIICGATNHREGDKVVVALPGATLPNGLTLKRAKIRGVESEGMMCSGKELAWSDDTAGILILPEEWKVGEPFDMILDVSITPNRPDCMSIHGLARDISAMHRKPMRTTWPRMQEGTTRIEQSLSVVVRERDLCSRYCARVIQKVQIGPSPLWMVRALESAGLRSINNVVDVTNYVLLELGHPLHAFDAEQIADATIEVRHPKAGEKLETLDGTKVALGPEDLVIADGARPVALAGVMGGANSEVTAKTKHIILEAAHFDPACVRRMSRRHGISSESSQRFERGTDRDILNVAIDRAAMLIHELSGGVISKGMIDAQRPSTETRTPIPLRLDRVTRVLGSEIPRPEIADLMTALGCEIRRADRDQFVALAPSWRVDLAREIDLIEEIARLRGYDTFPAALPAVVGQPRSRAPLSGLRDPLSRTLVGDGFREAINHSFLSGTVLLETGEDAERLVTLRNPISQDHTTMRPALLHGLLTNVAHNLNRGAVDVRLFEIGTVFTKLPDGTTSERQMLTACAAGAARACWDHPERGHDFFTIKGVAERMLAAFGVSQWQVKPVEDDRLHPHRAATLGQGPNALVQIGEVHPAYLDHFGIEARVCVLEIDLDDLSKRLSGKPRRSKEISRHPAVARDLALVVADSVVAAELETTLMKAGGEILESVHLFDVYQGEHIAKGKKSMAFGFVFRAADRTLVDDEVQTAVDAMLAAAKKDHKAALRK